MLFNLQVSISDAMRAQVRPPSSCPAKRAFLRFKVIGRIVFSTGLVSISTRPSVKKICSPSQWRWI